MDDPGRGTDLTYAVLFGLALGSCGAEPSAAPAPLCHARAGGIAQEALIGGGNGADYLALSGAERGAIGELEGSRSRTTCSGVRIADGWALSARHCAEAGLAFHGADGGIQTVEEWIAHPELDVALARLGAGSCGSVLPLVEAETVPSPLSRATLAGYGLMDDGKLGRLAFLVEEVVSLDEQTAAVNGFGRSGACVGDSGGPLLIRDRSGRVAVLGVLSNGAASCVEIDQYLRVEPVLGWIQSHLELPSASDDCGEIDARGRCFDGLAVYCRDGQLRSEACSDRTSCGFSPEADGFRCAETPRCYGDAFGLCHAGTAARCDDTGADAISCDALGLRCAYVASTGMASCL